MRQQECDGDPGAVSPESSAVVEYCPRYNEPFKTFRYDLTLSEADLLG